MSNFNLSWVVSTTFPGIGGQMDGPDWKVISEKLALVLAAAGSVQLEGDDEHGNPQVLEVRAENRAYLLTFGHLAEEDWVLLHYKNMAYVATDEREEIADHEWPKRCICYDEKTVSKVFAEFFEQPRWPHVQKLLSCRDC